MTTAWPLYGHSDAENVFLQAEARGRLHHAWLLEGPKGIGKSILAQRLAAHMLGAKSAVVDRVDAPVSDPVVQKCLADGHPDLRVVSRTVNDKGKLAQDISIDQIRDLTQFFSLKPAMGGWRVCIIDALDELNRNGENALLKTLEEPPKSAIIFLIYHHARPILPTIRSRCMRLLLSPLSDDNVVRALPNEPSIKSIVRMSRGQPGLGQRLASKSGQISINATNALLRSLPNPSKATIEAAVQAARIDDTAFEAFFTVIQNWLEDTSTEKPAYAQTWLQTSALLNEARALKMEPAQTAAKAIALLRSTAAKTETTANV